jgi:hypothetical protein
VFVGCIACFPCSWITIVPNGPGQQLSFHSTNNTFSKEENQDRKIMMMNYQDAPPVRLATLLVMTVVVLVRNSDVGKWGDLLIARREDVTMSGFDTSTSVRTRPTTTTMTTMMMLRRNSTNTNVSLSCEGKERLVKMIVPHQQQEQLKQSLMNKNSIVIKDDTTRTKIRMDELCRRLPTWNSVTELYGREPIIVGMDTCEMYRSQVHSTNTIAIGGLPNTGTNSINWNELFESYKERIGHELDFNTPNIKEFSWANQTIHVRRIDPITGESLLPIILVRDPYQWMATTCDNHTDIRLMSEMGQISCPNLMHLASTGNGSTTTNARQIRTTLPNGTMVHDPYSSLSDLLSRWNNHFLQADWPRLMIRYEDLLFHTGHVLDKIMECLSGQHASPNTQYQQKESVTSSLPSTTSSSFLRRPSGNIWRPDEDIEIDNDFVEALVRNGKHTHRTLPVNEHDSEYLWSALNRNLIQVFHYEQPENLEQEKS